MTGSPFCHSIEGTLDVLCEEHDGTWVVKLGDNYYCVEAGVWFKR